MAKFSKIEDVLSKKQEGKTVKIRGWVYRKREMKDKIFLVIRDTSDIIQAVIDSKSESWQDAQKITVESSVELEGIIHEDKRAPTGFEMQTKSLHIVGLAERWPISRDKSDEFLLDVRHLWVRSRQLQAVFKIRSKVFEAIHEYFRTHDYYEVQSPIFTPAAGEGGSTQFEVKYFGKKLFLAQTWQLYAEAMLPSLERIYCIAPSFRAEKSRTTRHLTEYWHAEMEVAWMDFDGLQKAAEELVSHICQKVSKDCVKELEVLGQDSKKLAKIKPPFPRLTYDEALKKLAELGMKIPYGKDLRTIEERKLIALYEKPLIVTHYPKSIKAFYMKVDDKDPTKVLSFDMLAPGVGEIIGASEREVDIKDMIARLKAQGEDPKKYEFYLDTRRYGTIPHSGFGLGVERVIQWICGLEHIRDAIAFPRTMTRMTP